MSKKPILVVGDIHHHTEKAEKIMSEFGQDCTIVQVGDVFDDFDDSPKIANQTAQWLKYSIAQPNRIHLLGNHDLPYAPVGKLGTDPGVLYPCPGYDADKDQAINRVLSASDWKQTKLYHQGYGWFITHAGMHPHWFEHPIKGTDSSHLLNMLNQAENDLHERIINPIVAAIGFSRGGTSRVGGILWLDHFREATPLQGVKQAYGHTPQPSLKHSVIEENNGININLDNGLSQVLKIYPNGDYEMIDTGLGNFYHGPA
jgi:hypothetical protein